MKLTSYLVFNGVAEEAAGFYANALGDLVLRKLTGCESDRPHIDLVGATSVATNR